MHDTEAAALTSPLKRARQTDRRGKAPVAIFEPARDAVEGRPNCAHCGATPKTMYILRRHIEEGHCKQVSSTKPVGTHVPCTWPWLLQQAQQMPPHAILTSDTTMMALCQACALCGQHLQRTGAILPHITNDHAQILDAACAQHPEVLTTLVKEARCHCPCKSTTHDHRCPIHYQILLLHFGPKHDPVPGSATTIWENAELRAKLTSTCAMCDVTCGINELREHLLRHETLFTDSLALLPLAQSPFMDCCSACLQAPDLPQFCPVALNLCGLRRCSHDGRRPPGRVERKLGQPPESGTAAQASETRGDGHSDKTQSAGLKIPSSAGSSARVPATGHALFT